MLLSQLDYEISSRFSLKKYLGAHSQECSPTSTVFIAQEQAGAFSLVIS